MHNVQNQQQIVQAVPLDIGIILIFAPYVIIHVMDVLHQLIYVSIVLMDSSMLVIVMVHVVSHVSAINLVIGIQLPVKHVLLLALLAK